MRNRAKYVEDKQAFLNINFVFSYFFSLNISADINLTCKIDAKLMQKGGKNYLVIKNVSLVMSKPKNVHYQFDGLYNGNAELSATANDFLNANALEIFEGMRSGIQETFALIVHDFMEKVFNKWAYEDLFLPE